MSVPNQTPYIIYTANGLTTVFPFEFYIINAGDIQVSINGTIATSGYSVSGVGNVGGGGVTFITPPASGSVVMLERAVPTYRLTDYQDNGDLLADTVNKDFDRLWMAIQCSFIYLGLALRRPLFGGPFDAEGYRIAGLANPVDAQDAATKNYVDNVSLVRALRVPESVVSILPPADQRANKLLAFNALGQPITVVPQSGSASDVLIELAKPTGASLIGVQPQGTLAEMEYYFTPEQFDAVGDGVANDTTAVNNCMTAAKNAGCSVRGKIGSTYGVGVVVHPLGLKRVYDLQLKCIIPGTDAVYRSEFVNGHTDVTINGVSVNINSNASKGIMIHGFADSLITKCRVFGFSGLIDSYGIRIGTPDLTLVSRNNKITDNYVLMPTDPAGGTGTYGLNGIALMGNASSPYGGFEVAGSAIWPSVITILDTEISGNYVYGGTHNITGAGIFRANIHHNNLQSPSHRNVNLSGNCQRTKVLHNFLLEAGSSGVNMAWGNRWNLIQGNFIQSNSSAAQTTDDAALQVHKGGDNVTFSDNIILGDWKYGIYIGPATQGIKVHNNQILAGSLANIAIESDWAGMTLPALAIYSERRDPNVIPVAASCNDIHISGNTVGGTGCAYYLCTFNGKSLTGVKIEDETVMNVTSRSHVLYVYDSVVNMSDVDLVDIKARSVSTAQIFSDRGRAPFGRISNVTLMDGPSEVSTSSATPSAMFGPKMFITGGASVTNFVNGQLGQTLELRLDVGTTLVHSNSTLRLKGNTNVASTSANQLLTITQRATGVWFEVSRNF
ncbi:phage tail fiber protein [uncultured Enterobacter sp.]|uniref:phage tail fiber domain-containing protein n=1 Tax=uncultured Enterobacter sp. TaxID=238202 RepID=UPI00259471A7|nr:phage tail fiber protein [uncultured Enterobacter sp.]